MCFAGLQKSGSRDVTHKEGGNTKMVTQWEGFKPGNWQETIDVRDFIQRNYTPIPGMDHF